MSRNISDAESRRWFGKIGHRTVLQLLAVGAAFLTQTNTALAGSN